MEEDTPAPDHHLINLWTTHHQLLHRYITRGKHYHDLEKLRLKHKESKRYERELANTRWLEHCESFNKHTTNRKLWKTFRAPNGKKKSSSNLDKIALATGLLLEQLEKLTAKAFSPKFFEITPSTPRSKYPRKAIINEDGPEYLFIMAEIEVALSQVKANRPPARIE